MSMTKHETMLECIRAGKDGVEVHKEEPAMEVYGELMEEGYVDIRAGSDSYHHRVVAISERWFLVSDEGRADEAQRYWTVSQSREYDTDEQILIFYLPADD